MVFDRMLNAVVLRGARFWATLPLPRALESLVLEVVFELISTPVVLVQFLWDVFGFA